ncbi:hypothetical protein [Nonomuraea basaltis]|uniref:hypothetical protein n=1 Tax=Nonomuraea basaltis TaxID=2495887 RepID=UPI00110C665F|nr:hypothetical protein [Nonomuraea basaltis]TMS00158.1 hypothetical protein EJK15_03540 [Nonomuraea basaltis]
MPISSDSCNGPCNTGARRAIAAYEQALDAHIIEVDAWIAAGQQGECPPAPAEPVIESIPGDPLWCSRCKSLVRAALLDLDVLASELAARADGHRGVVAEGRVSGSKGAPSPSPIGDALDKLYGFLSDLEDEWRQTCGYAQRVNRTHRGAHPRSRTIGWLSEHLGNLLADDDHIKSGLDILRWEIVLRALADEEPIGSVSPIRCPRCAIYKQVMREQEHHWACKACGRLIPDWEERELRDKQGRELDLVEAS